MREGAFGQGFLLVAALAEGGGRIRAKEVCVIGAVGVVAVGAASVANRCVNDGLVLDFVTVGASLIGRGERFEAVLRHVLVLMAIEAFLLGNGAVHDLAGQEGSVALAVAAVLGGRRGFRGRRLWRLCREGWSCDQQHEHKSDERPSYRLEQGAHVQFPIPNSRRSGSGSIEVIRFFKASGGKEGTQEKNDKKI